MIKSLVSLFLFSLFFSCSKYDLPKCDFNDATQDLPWLKEIIDERNANPTEDMRYCYILQAKFKRKTVFVLADCNPEIDKAFLTLNCEGDPLKDRNGHNIGVSETDLKDEIIIWRPDDFGCDANGNTIN